MGSVLLTNAQQRKTLSAVRSLGSKGVYTLVAETTRMSPAAFSKYCGKRYVYPTPSEHTSLFYDWLLQTIHNTKCDVLFPMDDAVMDIVIEHRQELEQICHLPIPSTESYRRSVDKGEAVKLAIEAGIGCPITIFPASLDHLLEDCASLAYPMVIKPRRSSGSRGIRVVYDAAALVDQYEQIHKAFPWPIVQEYIPQGERFDVCLLFNRHNELRATFVQKELRHFPLKMGPSTMQESVLYPELVAQAMTLMKNLPWFGIIEIEFMIDMRDGKPKFMEINPRFWNSLHLAVQSGVDFPWLLYKLVTDGDIEEVTEYKVGCKCRWLLPGDMLHFAVNPKRLRLKPPLWAGKSQGVQDDILSLDDPMPTIGFVLACLRYLFDRKMWKLMFNR